MQQHFFAVPALHPEAAQEEVNAFCAAHRVVAVERQFVAAGLDSYWAVCVVVVLGAGPLPEAVKVTGRRSGARNQPGATARVDYRAVLSAVDFTLFAALRAWRKTTAEQEGVPIYAVLTNEQLAEIARRRVSSPAALGEIDGIGVSRIERYGAGVAAVVQAQPATVEGK